MRCLSHHYILTPFFARDVHAYIQWVVRDLRAVCRSQLLLLRDMIGVVMDGLVAVIGLVMSLEGYKRLEMKLIGLTSH